MKKRLNFDGGTHRDDEFPPDERSKMRQRNEHYDNNFLEPDEFLRQTGLKWVSDMGKAAPGFIKAFLAVGSMAAAYITLKTLGVF